MSYIIINGHRGLPCAVFEVTRETPKRFYGDLADTISDGSMSHWFWLNGLIKKREPGTSYVIKEIVACEIADMDQWFAVKDRLAEIKNTYNDDHKAAERTLGEARTIAYEAEAKALESAEKRAAACLEGIA